jgi:hypothetical protein
MTEEELQQVDAEKDALKRTLFETCRRFVSSMPPVLDSWNLLVRGGRCWRVDLLGNAAVRVLRNDDNVWRIEIGGWMEEEKFQSVSEALIEADRKLERRNKILVLSFSTYKPEDLKLGE